MGRLPVAIAIISFDYTLLSSYELDFLAPPAPLSTEVLSRHLQLWCTPYIVQIHFLGDITVSFDWCWIASRIFIANGPCHGPKRQQYGRQYIRVHTMTPRADESWT